MVEETKIIVYKTRQDGRDGSSDDDDRKDCRRRRQTIIVVKTKRKKKPKSKNEIKIKNIFGSCESEGIIATEEELQAKESDGNAKRHTPQIMI